MLQNFDQVTGYPRVYGIGISGYNAPFWPASNEDIYISYNQRYYAGYMGYNYYRSQDFNPYYWSIHEGAKVIKFADKAVNTVKTLVDFWNTYIAACLPIKNIGTVLNMDIITTGISNTHSEHDIEKVLREDILQWAVLGVLEAGLGVEGAAPMLLVCAARIMYDIDNSKVYDAQSQAMYDNGLDIITRSIPNSVSNSYFKLYTNTENLGNVIFGGCNTGCAKSFVDNYIAHTYYKNSAVYAIEKCSPQDNNNIIWGTTNFNDLVVTGNGDDTHYLYEGNDVSYDCGGYDTYKYPLYELMGNNIIYDSDGIGAIYIGTIQIKGNAIPILKTDCTIITRQVVDGFIDPNTSMWAAYLLPVHIPTADPEYMLIFPYYLIIKKQTNTQQLFISAECPDSESQIKNSITIMDFNWGNFGISLEPDQSLWATVGAKEALTVETYPGSKVMVPWMRDLDCSSRPGCYAWTMTPNYIIHGRLSDTTVLLSSRITDLGNKYKHTRIELNNLPYKRTMAEGNLTSTKIQGLKGNDVIDLSDMHLTNDVTITQNGTHVYIDLGQGNVIHTQTYLLHNFAKHGSNITVQSQGALEAFAEAILDLINQTNSISSSSFATDISTPVNSANWCGAMEKVISIIAATATIIMSW